MQIKHIKGKQRFKNVALKVEDKSGSLAHKVKMWLTW